MTGKRKSSLSLLALGAALQLLCARIDPVEPKGSPDVQPLGEPVKRSLPVGTYIIPLSFGGIECVIHDPALNYDPDYLQFLKELQEQPQATVKFAIIRYADLLWEGLVKNIGDLAADSVYVRISFAGGWVDSAYVSGFRVAPNETAAYQLYSRGQAIDRIDVIWHQPE